MKPLCIVQHHPILQLNLSNTAYPSIIKPV
jgi:hypothetical protein